MTELGREHGFEILIMPHELSVFSSGAVAPVAVVWVQAGRVAVALWAALMAAAEERMVELLALAVVAPLAAGVGPDMVAALAVSAAAVVAGPMVAAAVELVVAAVVASVAALVEETVDLAVAVALASAAAAVVGLAAGTAESVRWEAVVEAVWAVAGPSLTTPASSR